MSTLIAIETELQRAWVALREAQAKRERHVTLLNDFLQELEALNQSELYRKASKLRIRVKGKKLPETTSAEDLQKVLMTYKRKKLGFKGNEEVEAIEEEIAVLQKQLEEVAEIERALAEAEEALRAARMPSLWIESSWLADLAARYQVSQPEMSQKAGAEPAAPILEYIQVSTVGKKLIPDGYTLHYHLSGGTIVEGAEDAIAIKKHGKTLAWKKTVLAAKRFIYQRVGPLHLPDGYTIAVEGKHYAPQMNGGSFTHPKKGTKIQYSTLEEAENFIFREYRKAYGEKAWQQFNIESTKSQ